MEAVLDRIVDGRFAVLLVGEEEEEHMIPMFEMPQGSKEGMKFNLSFIGKDIISIEIMNEEVGKSQELNEKLALLRKRKQSRFKRP